MSIVRILGAGYPVCAHEGCNKHGEDGYCLAACCKDTGRAFCSEHSHRPKLVLEMLGYPVSTEQFTRKEVEHIVQSLWQGAGPVFEAAGVLQMLYDLKRKREEAGEPVGDIGAMLRP